MDKLKQYIVFTVLGSLVVLAAGWFLLVSPKRTNAAELRDQAATQVAANQQLSTKLAVLKAQAKALPKQQAKLAAVAAKIPDNPALPALIRALTTAAVSSGVELVSVTPAAPTAATPATGGTLTAPRTTGTAASASSAGQLASIPVSLSVVGGYFQTEQFVANLENLPRSMRVSNLSMAPGANPLKKAPTGASAVSDGSTLASTINAQVFMAANRPAATAVTVPGQPVTSTAVTPAGPVTPAKK